MRTDPTLLDLLTLEDEYQRGQGHEVAKRTLDAAELPGTHNGSCSDDCPSSAGHTCSLEWAASLSYQGDSWCERPQLLACRCGRQEVVRCKATRVDRCGPCAEVHRRDIAAVIRSGVTADRPEGFFWCTISAPGVEVLPWDVSKCGHAEGECSGELGCVVDEHAAAEWNGRAPLAWSHFVTDLRRTLGVHVEFAGSWETQLRGVLHRHFLLWAPGVSERRVRAAVRLAASRYRFGRQYDVQAISGACARDVARVAGYCAAYAVKGEAEHAVLLDVRTGEVRRGGYRRWSASRKWGDSMRCVRARRVAYWQQGGPAPAGAGAAAGGEAALDPYQDFYAGVGVEVLGSVMGPPAAAAAVAV